MDLGFEGDTVLVTAASSGLGKASARAVAASGADVVICSRSPDALAAAADDIRETATGQVEAVPADLTDPDDIDALVEATVDEFGGLDHLITSAGGPPSGSFLEMEDRDWYQAYDLLVMSVVRTLDTAYPHLAESEKGTLTCITSTSVVEPVENLVLSNAVRRGVVGLVKTVSRELAPEIRANVVMPGAHETPRITDLVEAAVERGDYASYEEGLADWSDPVPLDRIGDPVEFGNVVAFVASDRAGYVNGASIPVDGGNLRS